MFKKILTVEDIDIVNIGISIALEDFSPDEIHHVKYCDDALLKIKRALADKTPYDLLITDLSFQKDHRDVFLTSGVELVAAVRDIQPSLKIIAYSIEDRPLHIKRLFEKYRIDAYVAKGRNSTNELKTAIRKINCSDEKYISIHLSSCLRESSVVELEERDIELLVCLSAGMTNKEISKTFEEKNYSSSESSIEKRISRLKIYFDASNRAHIACIAKEMGII